MNNLGSKIFGCKYLRHNILKYILVKRCFSCKTILTNNKTIEICHYKDYNNTLWRSQQNVYMKSVCNWCYYYVYEYP